MVRPRLPWSSSPEPFSTVDDRDADFNDLDPEKAAADMELFQRQCEHSRSVVEAAGADEPSVSTEKSTVSLRWIMIHMIEEYARHSGPRRPAPRAADRRGRGEVSTVAAVLSAAPRAASETAQP